MTAQGPARKGDGSCARVTGDWPRRGVGNVLAISDAASEPLERAAVRVRRIGRPIGERIRGRRRHRSVPGDLAIEVDVLEPVGGARRLRERIPIPIAV